jgi:cardiolipin synthase A/B
MIRAMRLATALWCSATLAGCATLPDTQFLTKRYVRQAARFESARGALSEKQSAALLGELKRKAGDLNILEKQIALEQELSSSPLVVGNKVTLLQDGPATYAAMFDAIRGAKDHINVESYIIDDDALGREFASLLLERQARGVQVNLIYDSIGALSTPRAYFDRLMEGGVRVLEYNPVSPAALIRPASLNQRDHRKLLIVDGRIAFLGGINISSVYSSGSSAGTSRARARRSSGWRDTDIQVEGPVVAEFQKLFIQTWNKQHAPPLAARDYFPQLAAQGNDIVRAVGSTPDDPYSLIYLTLVSAISNAEINVHLTNAYFVPDPQIIKALLDAAARGVDVRLILPSYSDNSMPFHAGRSHYQELLAGGVKIYERRGALLHVKSASVDGVWSVVGSTNLDWRSALSNDEIDAVILGREFARQMDAAFADDIAASERIEINAWKRRPLVVRFKEAFARLIGRLL